MDQKFFIQPFATAGDKTAIPDGAQPSGSVSFNVGFGIDYERDLATDPLAKSIPRYESNYLYFAITQALSDLQKNGTPEFITPTDNGGAPFPYAKGAMVRWRASGGDPYRVYVSKVDANTAPPSDVASWVPFPEAASNAEITAATSEVKFVSPAGLAFALASISVSVPAATTVVAGITRYATSVETSGGTVTNAAVTPAGLLFALNEQIPQATTAVAGRTRYATALETATGMLTSAAVTPAGLSAAIPQATTAVAGRTRYASTLEATAAVITNAAVTPAGLADRALLGANVSFAAITGTSYNKSSSRHLKCDLAPLPYGLAELLQIETAIGRYVPGYGPDDRRHLFLIAEQLRKVIGEPVNLTGVEWRGQLFPTVDYTEMVPVLVRAIQDEHHARVRAIQDEHHARVRWQRVAAAVVALSGVAALLWSVWGG